MPKLMRMSQIFVRTLREDPSDAEVKSHRLLTRAGYIRRAAPGIYSWLPLGLAVKSNIERIAREEMEAINSQEVHFPALLPREPYDISGRWVEYGDNLFRLQDRKEADYLLAPTHEEMFTLLVKDMCTSYKDLPLSLYQIQDKYRDEARPRAGLLRGREFTMKDAYSFDIDAEGLEKSYQDMRGAYLRIFERLQLEVVPVKAVSGAMGGSKSEEFLHPTAVGEDTYVRSQGGYAANAEAVETIVPEDYPTSDEDFKVVDTPDSTTIDSLVHVINEQGYNISAEQTLKNVVLAVTKATGDREIIVVGLPGNREVDLKRIEANLNMGEIDIENANPKDLEDQGLLAGYIGPITLQGEQFLGTEGQTGLRYLVDPRIVEGSSWVTGANKNQQHVVNLVAGRDFSHDGFIECAQIQEGDLAPDGSGKLEIARGIELGHIFQLGTKYAQALGLKVLDQNGKQVTVTMGSYGFGVTRALAAIAEQTGDDKGLCWPAHLAPAQVHLVAAGKNEEILNKAEELAEQLYEAGISVLYDDRTKISPGVKFGDAELLGMPYIMVVGRGLKDGTIELKNRATGNATNIPVENAVEKLVEELKV
ncbi:MAG: proline--tRNA ligase [Micrococcaceae bacterium]